MATSSTIQCSLCNFQFLHPVDHVKHVIAFHQHQPQFAVQCSFDNCGKIFNKWPSFKKHLQRNHQAQTVTLSDEVDFEAHSIISPESDEQTASDNEVNNSTWDAAEYVLSLREQGLTQDCVTAVISATQTLVEKTVTKVKRNASDLLRGSTDIIDSKDWDDTFSASDVFRAVDTKWKQDSFFKAAFNLLVSVCCPCICHTAYMCVYTGQLLKS